MNPGAGAAAPAPVRRAAAVGALIAAVLLFLYDPRLMDGSAFLGGTDVTHSHFWFRSYLQERLRDFTLPLWAPHFFGGHPFLAYPEMCVFHPSTLLFLLLPIPWAFTVNYGVHLLLAALGTRALVRLHTSAPSAGIVAGLCFALGGYMADRLNAGHISYVQSAALLPWLVWSHQRALTSSSWRRPIETAVIFALLVLASPPHNALYALFFLAVQTAFFVADARSGGTRLRCAAVLATSAAGGVLLSAAQILPTLEFARLTDRMDASYEFATSFSFPPALLVRLFAPRFTAEGDLPLVPEFGVDIGALGFVLALASALSARRSGAARLYVTVGVIGLVLMLGGHLPTYRLLLAAVPPLGWFRVPARAELLVNLSLAVLAGLALDPARSFLRARLGAVGLAGGVLGILWALHPADGAVLGRAALGVIAAALVLGLLPSRHARKAAVLAPLLVFADLYASHHAEVPIDEVRPLVARTDLAQPRSDPRRPSRVFVDSGADLDRGLYFGYEDVNGYAPLVLARYYHLVSALAGVTPDPMRRHFLPPAIADTPRPLLARYLGVARFRDRRGGWHDMRAEDVFPRVRFVDGVIATPDPVVQIATLIRDPRVVAGRLAVVGSVPPDLQAQAPAPGHEGPPEEPRAELLEYAPESLTVSVSTDRTRLLVFSELAYPGWRAEVDGRAVPVLTADFAFRAVVVPAGASRVTLRYDPLSLALGLSVSLGSAGVALLAWLRGQAAPGRDAGDRRSPTC